MRTANDKPNTKAASGTSKIRVLTMKLIVFNIFFLVSSVAYLSVYFFTDMLRDTSPAVNLVMIAVMFVVIYFATKTRKALERAQSVSQR